jgi:hypothetical protein
MKAAIIALSAATLFAAAPVFAQSVSSKAPGHEMRAKAKKGHPGASGYLQDARCKPTARRKAIRALPVTRLVKPEISPI